MRKSFQRSISVDSSEASEAPVMMVKISSIARPKATMASTIRNVYIKLVLLGTLYISIAYPAALTVTWTKQTMAASPNSPGFNGYLDLRYDPLSGCILHNGIPYGSQSIYSGTMWCYKATTNTWTSLASNNSTTNQCTAALANRVPDSHAISQMAVDSNHNRYWFWPNVDGACGTSSVLVDRVGTAVTLHAGSPYPFPNNNSWVGASVLVNGSPYTVASVQDTSHLTLTTGTGSETSVFISLTGTYLLGTTQLYYYNLNSDPTQNTWSRVLTPHYPLSKSGEDTMQYDPVDNILINYGFSGFNGSTWVYCPTDLNPTPGTLTANQVSAGCARSGGLDDWTQVTVVGSPPTASAFTKMVWVSSIQKMIMYGGTKGDGTPENEFWTYAPLTKTWTHVCLSCTLPPTYTSSNCPVGQPAGCYWALPGLAYVPGIDRVIFHQTSNTGRPQDWAYDPVHDTLALITTVGNGPVTYDAEMEYDTATGNLVTWSYDPTLTNHAAVWLGKVSFDLALTGATAGQFRTLETWPSGNIKWLKVCGILASLTAGSTATVTLTGPGISIPLTVLEALYPGGNTGVDRTNEPFCVGTPIPDSAGVTSATGNFGGNNLASGSSTITVATGTMTATIKSANFNGLDTVTVGATPVVLTSAAETRGFIVLGPSTTGTFPDNVTCGNASGQSPCTKIFSSANDATSSCTTEENGPVLAIIRCIGTHKDSSGNPYMQFTVRETFYANKTGVKIQSVLRNANYNTSAVPSPDCGASVNSVCPVNGTFNTAWKGMSGYELRLGSNLTGTLNYTIATNATAQTGALSGTDSAFIYQGYESFIGIGDCGGINTPCWNQLTTDQGWVVKKTISNVTSTVASGAVSTCPEGWANIENSSGVGVEIGAFFMCGNFPMSLEFQGSDVRIGLFSQQNSVKVYEPWPSWDTKTVWMNFHSSTQTTQVSSDEFAKFQAFLVAHASIAQYNNANVFLTPIPDTAGEDTYYQTTGAAANPAQAANKWCCILDKGTANGSYPITVTRQNFNWGGGGGPSLQEEFRLNDLWIFIRRNFTGRYLNSHNFFQMELGRAWPHADGNGPSASTVNSFLWSSRPQAGTANAELSTSTQPLAANKSVNLDPLDQNLIWVNLDQNHPHWHGIQDYYAMTGDELYKEAFLSFKAYYLDTHAAQATSGGLGTTRAYGMELYNSAKFSETLSAISDSDAANVLVQGVNGYTNNVLPDVCVKDGAGNVYPTGCTLPAYAVYGGDTTGISRVRGMHIGNGNRNQGYCADFVGYYRSVSTFLENILVEGLLYLRRVKGTSWNQYINSGDLAYGVARYILDDAFHYDGTALWKVNPVDHSGYLNNGIPYLVWWDNNQVCPGGTPLAPVHQGYPPNSNGYTFDGGTTIYDGSTVVFGMQGTFTSWWWIQQVNGTLSALETRKLNIAMANASAGQSGLASIVDFGGYQLGASIYSFEHPTGLVRQPVPFTLTSLGSGSYRLTFTSAAGTTSLRAKYSTTKSVVESLGYNNQLGTFATSPATNAAWFAATAVPTDPIPTPGVQQTFDISTGQTGLAIANFSLTGLSPGSCTLAPTSLPAGTVSDPYTVTLVPNFCSSSTFMVGSGLCGGLSLDGSTGIISGTLTTAQTCNFTITYDTASQPLSIVVNAVPTITTASLSDGLQGVPYSGPLSVSGGTAPVSCSVTSGSVPVGTTLSNCIISGTPTTIANYSFTIIATDFNDVNSAPKNFTINITNPNPTVSGTVFSGIVGSGLVKSK